MRGSLSEVNYSGVRAVAIIQPHHQSCHRGMVLSRDPVVLHVVNGVVSMDKVPPRTVKRQWLSLFYLVHSRCLSDPQP